MIDHMGNGINNDIVDGDRLRMSKVGEWDAQDRDCSHLVSNRLGCDWRVPSAVWCEFSGHVNALAVKVVGKSFVKFYRPM
jgi:hypothetical protein